MEKKLKTIDYELEQTEKRLEDLLAGIKQLRKEVHDMLPKEVKKVVHERVVLDSREIIDEEIDLRDYLRFFNPNDIHIVNIVRYDTMGLEKFNFYNDPIVQLTLFTKRNEVIITYLPEDKLVIIVER